MRPRRTGSRSACRTLRLKTLPGTEPWVPSEDDLGALACALSQDVTVTIAPRSAIRQIWQEEHGAPLPVDPGSFRAWSRPDGRAFVFVDATETRPSVLWLIAHELAHIDLGASRLLSSAYRSVPRASGYLCSDDVHEADPEEKLANLVADRTLATLGRPGGFDRRWWRERMKGSRIKG